MHLTQTLKFGNTVTAEYNQFTKHMDYQTVDYFTIFLVCTGKVSDVSQENRFLI